jgi:hypothetical protein
MFGQTNFYLSVAPKIKTPLNDIRIKAGLILHLDIDFIGEPCPEATWTVGSKALTANDRTTVTSIGYHTVIHTVNAKRSDSGLYHLLLKNNSGIDEGSFQVIVLGKLFKKSSESLLNDLF